MALTKGGPAQSTESISYLIYNNGMSGGTVWIPECQCGYILYCDRDHFCSAVDYHREKGGAAVMKTKVREKANWPVTILLILGLITVVFPLYMTIVIAFKQPTEMTNSVAGILSLPEKFSLANFREAMEVTDFWHSLGNSVLITVITVVLAIVIHSLLGYAIARNKRSKFYKFIYLYVVSGMFVPFAILMMPLVKQTAEMGLITKSV